MMIADIEHVIAAHVERYRRNEPGALIEALLHVAKEDLFCSMIEATLSNRQMLERAVQRSSIHNNGFLKIILATSADYQLRLHVWDCRDDGFSSVQESVHSHTADFASTIVAGGYRHEQFREASEGETFHSYSYTASRGSRSFSLTDTGIKHLQLVSDGLLPPGTTYTLAGDILHRVVPTPSRLTASLVIQGPPRYSFVQVFADEPLNAGTEIAVKPLTIEKLTRYASEVAAEFSVAPAKSRMVGGSTA